jgi:ATP-binding cassette, subfamily A (ABC1), member 3
VAHLHPTFTLLRVLHGACALANTCRIAIINRGRLQCTGSPLFLKARWGLGYNLSLVRAPATSPPLPPSLPPPSQLIGDEAPADTGAGGDGGGDALSALVHTHVPAATVLSDAAGEVTYRLPFAEAASFSALFKELEGRSKDLGEHQRNSACYASQALAHN